MNSLSLVGALTKDPELKGSGESRVCRLRLVEASGPSDQPLYINVSVFGSQAEGCHAHLRKGRQVAVVGRLRFREWQRVDGARRSEYWIVADRVDFLSRATAPARPPRRLPRRVRRRPERGSVPSPGNPGCRASLGVDSPAIRRLDL